MKVKMNIRLYIDYEKEKKLDRKYKNDPDWVDAGFTGSCNIYSRTFEDVSEEDYVFEGHKESDSCEPPYDIIRKFLGD